MRIDPSIPKLGANLETMMVAGGAGNNPKLPNALLRNLVVGGNLSILSGRAEF